MTTNDMPDPILRLLAHLPPAAPPTAIDQRVRSRCHRALEKQRSRAQPRASAAGSARVIDVALAMTAGIYAVAVAVEALRLAGVL
jgi:hypothetical protein